MLLLEPHYQYAEKKVVVNVLPQRCYRFEADIGRYTPLYNRKRTSVF